jgi:uncharacterized protein with PIN domain
MKIHIEDIRGFDFDRELICFKCSTLEEQKTAEETQILTDHDVNGDELYFCDRCNKKL